MTGQHTSVINLRGRLQCCLYNDNDDDDEVMVDQCQTASLPLHCPSHAQHKPKKTTIIINQPSLWSLFPVPCQQTDSK